ncbi:MAG TPA: DUF2383 domain-containing protein [Geminicoccaceae bacterium]
MLRDELEVCLNDVLVALQEAADGHESAAPQVGERPEAALLRQLVERRRADAQDLAGRLRAMGARPREADSEYETVLGMFAQVKASLAPDEVESLLEDRAEAEARIVDMADLALACDDLPGDVADLLEKLKADARRAAGELGPTDV